MDRVPNQWRVSVYDKESIDPVTGDVVSPSNLIEHKFFISEAEAIGCVMRVNQYSNVDSSKTRILITHEYITR